jgi:hypothetical protein
MKYKSIIAIMLVMLIPLLPTVAALIDTERQNDRLQIEIAQLQQLKEQYITLTEDFTLIRSSEDYIYLSSLTINRDIWESATKQTDINGVTWYEIMQDGYIKVYAEGHVMPDSIHWYAPY